MSRTKAVNEYIRRIFKKQDIKLAEHVDVQNPRDILFFLALENEREDIWDICVTYNDKSDTVIIAIKSNTDLTGIPEYDVLQWLNEENNRLPRGCFTYEKEQQALFMHYQIDVSVLEQTAEWNTSFEETQENSILIMLVFSMFSVMQKEESLIAEI